MSDDSPPLYRPIPRRPFDLNLTSPTPPDEDSVPPSPIPDLQNLRFINTPYGLQPGLSDTPSLSRAQSIMNLTASTLFGIFSPTVDGSKDRLFGSGDEPETPWGTGARTPIKRASVDDTTYELMKKRSSQLKSRLGPRAAQQLPPPSTTELLVSLGVRAAILFALGMGYGALILRLRSDHNFAASFPMDDFDQQGYDWRYMVFWGVAGVSLGALQPWFDRLWEGTFGGETEQDQKDAAHGTDWALLVRGVGAFMGIIFAIRKLSWASNLQVSLTLALVNPFLWYLVDRSKPGFLLSLAVGLTGSVVLVGINPDIMPTPSTSLYRNESSSGVPEPLLLGGLASQETVEAGIWMLSVLFCSCVCFGNVGRRLALNKSAAARGMLGGVR